MMPNSYYGYSPQMHGLMRHNIFNIPSGLGMNPMMPPPGFTAEQMAAMNYSHPQFLPPPPGW